MIDKNTGNVTIETIEFGPQHTKTEFKNDPKFKFWNVLVSDDHELGSFVLRAMLENGQKWVIAVVFYGEKLGLISLSHELPDEPHESDWHNWQQETEDRRKAWHDSFLQDELGPPPYEYSWGDVDSFAETAGGRSAITVKYNTIRQQV